MKKSLYLLAGLMLATAAERPAFAQALDPGFAFSSIYAPGGVQSVAEQPDGKLILVGSFSRVNNNPAYYISRLHANGTLDAAFQQNVGVASEPYEVTLAGNGKIFLHTGGNSSITAGGITRTSLVRLNADGTGDASFNSGTGPTSQSTAIYLDDVLPLATGQVIVVGAFDRFNNVPANGIVRLSATGAVDGTFNTGTGIGGNEVNTIVPLANGQYLIGGEFTTYNGNPCNALARLNADGSFDPTFSSNLGPDTYLTNVVVQADGKILLSGNIYLGTATTSVGLARLLPAGGIDSGFTPPPFAGFASFSFSGNAIQVQPDGKIVLLSGEGIPSAGVARVARLNTNGTVDPTFQVGTGPNSMPSSLNLLTNGRLLVAGGFTDFNNTLDRTVVQLTNTGAIDASFQPVLQQAGSTAALVRQADGKIVAGGNFSEINGQVVRRLARFNANGTVDATFAPASTAGNVVSLALQPDGRLVVARPEFVERLLTNGSTDNSFAPPSYAGSNLTKMLLQTDGRLVLGASRLTQNGTALTPRITRLLTNGSVDNSFVPSSTAPQRVGSVLSLAQQADGKLLVGENRTVKRLDVSGAPDASFTVAAANARALAVQPDGKILVGGNSFATTSTGVPFDALVRLNSDGSFDNSFTRPAITGTINTVVVQPNNRILLGGAFGGASLPNNLARVLPTGQADASFGATAVPNGTVQTLLVQPDGKIMLGGSFTAVGNQPAGSLARLTAPNVLHMAAPQAVAARTEAWPVPAQGSLNVAPAPNARAQALDLLDALGRPVRHQALSGSATVTLPLTNLASGMYLLRVTYTEGTVTRRIEVQ